MDVTTDILTGVDPRALQAIYTVLGADVPINRQVIDRQYLTILPALQVRHLADVAGPLRVKDATVTEYAEIYGQGHDMGPLIVVIDQSDVCYLTDGFHRDQAQTRLDRPTRDCLLVPGDKAQAMQIACLANGRRGLAYGPGDKSKVSRIWLEAWMEQNPNQPLPSAQSVADILGFARNTVNASRQELIDQYQLPPGQLVSRGGTTFVQGPMTQTTPAGSILDDFSDAPAAYNTLPNAEQAARHEPGNYARNGGTSPRPPYAAAQPPQFHTGHNGMSGPVEQVIARDNRAIEARLMEDRPLPPGAGTTQLAVVIHWTMMQDDGTPQIGSAELGTIASLPLDVRRVLWETLNQTDL